MVVFNQSSAWVCVHFHVNVTSGSLWRWRRMEACPFLIPCSRGERMAAWLSPSTGSPHTLGHMRRMLCQWRCPRWCIRSPAVVARLTALLYGLTLLRWSRSPSTVPFFTIQQVSSTYLFQCQFFKKTLCTGSPQQQRWENPSLHPLTAHRSLLRS